MERKDIEKLVRQNIRNLVPYSTARDDFQGDIGVFLDANESPYPTGWNRYPDPHQKQLKSLIALQKRIDARNLFLGNGSDEAIDIIYRVFCTPSVDNAVIISPSYGMYSVCAEINDIKVNTVLLNDDFSLPVEKVLSSCDGNTKVIFLCSPNNPSGNAIKKDDLLSVVESFGGIVVVDEAYVDFSSAGSLKDEIAGHPNLVILQTCSKARGLAALRLGLAIADEYIIMLMSKIKYPYNISQSTQKAALEALTRPVDDEVREIISERERISKEITRYHSVRKVYPSDANFLLVEVDDANRMYDFLISSGIIVRNRTNTPLCRNCLRITIGLKSENENLLTSIENYEKGNIC